MSSDRTYTLEEIEAAYGRSMSWQEFKVALETSGINVTLYRPDGSFTRIPFELTGPDALSYNAGGYTSLPGEYTVIATWPDESRRIISRFRMTEFQP